MATGFFTDSTLCIGCKACEVACKQWNKLESDGYELTGNSYDNTGWLSGTTWRHVQFIEQFELGAQSQGRWLMNSDVCKHCVKAACLEVCPTGAIIRTEFDSVYIQPEVCNGCRDCIAACPFGVIETAANGIAQKCTFCYDRQQNGLEPACAKACPTKSIQFGDVTELLSRAEARVQTLQAAGQKNAYIYGKLGDGYTDDIGGLNAFFLLLDKPSVYGLPDRPQLASRATVPSQLGGLLTGALLALGAVFSFRNRGRGDTGGAGGDAPAPVSVAAPTGGRPVATVTAVEMDDRANGGR